MATRTITIEVTSDAQEAIARRAADLQRELEDLSDVAADGQVMDICEEAAVRARDEMGQRLLTQAVQRRVDHLEKKGVRGGSVLAVAPDKTA